MVNQTFETSGEPAPGCMNKARLNAQRCVKMCYRGKRDSSNSLSPSFGDILSYGGWKPKILMSIWKQTHVVPAVSKFTRAQGFWQIHMYTEVDLVWRRWREIMIYIYIYHRIFPYDCIKHYNPDMVKYHATLLPRICIFFKWEKTNKIIQYTFWTTNSRRWRWRERERENWKTNDHTHACSICNVCSACNVCNVCNVMYVCNVCNV